MNQLQIVEPNSSDIKNWDFNTHLEILQFLNHWMNGEKDG